VVQYKKMTQAELNKGMLIQSLRTLESAIPSSSAEIKSLLKKVEANTASSGEIEFALKKIRGSHQQIQQSDKVQNRITIDKLKRNISRFKKSTNYPKSHKDKLDTFVSIKDGDLNSTLEFLIDLHKLLSEDVINLRENSSAISTTPGNNGSESIIAGDIHWASKQIIKSFSPILLRMRHQYSDNKEIQSLNEKSNELTKANRTDFFEVINFMEDCMVEVTKVSQKVNQAESSALFAFQGHLEVMHEKLSGLISESSSLNQNKQRDKLNKITASFKKLSTEESDPIELRKIISSNVASMNSCFEEIITNQESQIKKINKSLVGLNEKIESQKVEMTNLVNEKNALDKVNDALNSSIMIDELTKISNRRAYEKDVLEITI